MYQKMLASVGCTYKGKDCTYPLMAIVNWYACPNLRTLLAHAQIKCAARQPLLLVERFTVSLRSLDSRTWCIFGEEKLSRLYFTHFRTCSPWTRTHSMVRPNMANRKLLQAAWSTSIIAWISLRLTNSSRSQRSISSSSQVSLVSHFFHKTVYKPQ